MTHCNRACYNIYHCRLQRSADVFDKLCVVTAKQEKVVISSEKLWVVTRK